MEIILKYFPQLTNKQHEQFAQLKELYLFWNEKINVISRKDVDNFYERHVLHSLAIAKVIQFNTDASILDIGTGGGFPGIPLAILFSNSKFTLIDSIGKKIHVVNEIATALQLTNVTAIHTRAEKVKIPYDFIVSRAVTQMDEFLRWVKFIPKKPSTHVLENGILYLKGGDLTSEMQHIKKYIKYFNISDFFSEYFFETKKVVYLK